VLDLNQTQKKQNQVCNKAYQERQNSPYSLIREFWLKPGNPDVDGEYYKDRKGVFQTIEIKWHFIDLIDAVVSQIVVLPKWPGLQ